VQGFNEADRQTDRQTYDEHPERAERESLLHLEVPVLFTNASNYLVV
jgi:hypothetical protein